MISLAPVLTDLEMGFVPFAVQRTTYRRQNGQSVPTVKTMTASGCIHPGSPEMIQLLPEEDRSEDFIAVYTDFALSLGENDGGVTYTTPDRIVWNGQTWRLVHLKDWPTFNYYQALAVLLHE